MFFNSQRTAPPTWTPEDVDAVKETLMEDFPAMPDVLRNAIVALAVEDVKPDEGQAALHRLAVRYARECPPTIGLEAALASLNRTVPASFRPQAPSGGRLTPSWQG